MKTDLEKIVGQMLRRRHLTLATAESCTGGLIADRLTDIPGSSGYFCGGVIAYSNGLKQSLLGVAAATLSRHGAVSDEVVCQMARGVRRLTGADIGLAVSGIAGPRGGSTAKPVGTVFMAIDRVARVWSQKYFLPAERRQFKILVSSLALDQLRLFLAGEG